MQCVWNDVNNNDRIGFTIYIQIRLKLFIPKLRQIITEEYELYELIYAINLDLLKTILICA